MKRGKPIQQSFDTTFGFFRTSRTQQWYRSAEKPIQNGIEGEFPRKIILHTLNGYAPSWQAYSRYFLSLAEHDKCRRTEILGSLYILLHATWQATDSWRLL